MLAVPNQTPGLIERYGLTRAEAEREVWVVDTSGRKHSATSAVNYTLLELGSGWALLSKLLNTLPFRWLEDWLYHRVAENRALLSRLWRTTPECAQPGAARRDAGSPRT